MSWSSLTARFLTSERADDRRVVDADDAEVYGEVPGRLLRGGVGCRTPACRRRAVLDADLHDGRQRLADDLDGELLHALGVASRST
jgi:hypothetical protein